MLTIEIVNDGTAEENLDEPVNGIKAMLGNYDYIVKINERIVNKGRIENHLRISGWEELISCLNREINGDKWLK